MPVPTETSPSMEPNIVWLNVYDMSPHNRYTYAIGLGVFHSGIEVYGKEFAFGGHDLETSGIFHMKPRAGVAGLTLRKSINLGSTTLNQREVHLLIQNLSREFTGKAYHIITRNCNHFSEVFARELCGGKVPGWVNRLAKFGSLLPCTLSMDELTQAAADISQNDNQKREQQKQKK